VIMPPDFGRVTPDQHDGTGRGTPGQRNGRPMTRVHVHRSPSFGAGAGAGAENLSGFTAPVSSL